ISLRQAAGLRVLAFLCFALSNASGLAQVTMSIGQNFTGISYGTYNTNSDSLPPDSNGEIGPNHYVEFINGMFAVYSKTNGEFLNSKTDVDFWGSAGVGVQVSLTTG